MVFLNFNMDQLNLRRSESINLKSLVVEGLNLPPAAFADERPRTALVRPRGPPLGRGGAIRVVDARERALKDLEAARWLNAQRNVHSRELRTIA